MSKKRILPIICALILTAFVSLFIRTCMRFTAEYPMAELDEGWVITVNGIVNEDIPLTHFMSITNGHLERGDNIVMTTTLPDLGDIPFPVILFKSRYTTLTAYLDSREIFDFGSDIYKENKFLGKTYHFITLPTDYAGKELKFIMKVRT